MRSITVSKNVEAGPYLCHCCKTMTGKIVFVVEDNGVGMSPETLAKIQSALREGKISEEIGVGLFNVNQRLRLYYETEGLQITSTYGVGTSVSFEIPQQRGEGDRMIRVFIVDDEEVILSGIRKCDSKFTGK